MQQEIHQHTFANGMTLLVERIPHVRSAAFSFILPSGSAYEPVGQRGVAAILTELIGRGAGERTSEQLIEALDRLGVDGTENTGVLSIRANGSMLARNLAPTLAIYADIIRRPHLLAEELEPAKNLAYQALQSLADSPQALVFSELGKRILPPPLNRDHRGERADIEALTIEQVREFHHRYVRPQGTILAVAGNVEWTAVLDQVGQLFADWQGETLPPLRSDAPFTPRSVHIPREDEQTQIAIAFPTVPIRHEDYYQISAAVGILSHGMSSRLFSEVREKYGLCYAVYASYTPILDKANVVTYAGARPELAAETLVRTLNELVRLKNGLDEEELARVRARIKADQIMRQESTLARARTLAGDWLNLGRVRPIAEIQAAIDALTPESVLAHLNSHPPKSFTIVTLGPEPLLGMSQEG